MNSLLAIVVQPGPLSFSFSLVTVVIRPYGSNKNENIKRNFQNREYEIIILNNLTYIYLSFVPYLADDAVAERLSRPAPALLLLLERSDIGAGDDDIIILCDITNVDGVFLNSPVLGMIFSFVSVFAFA